MPKKVFFHVVPAVLRFEVIAETVEESVQLLKDDLKELQAKHGGTLKINPNSDLYQDVKLSLNVESVSKARVVGSQDYTEEENS